MKLIKFQAYNNFTLEGLINNTLFFNILDKLNDPFEGVIRYGGIDDINILRNFLRQNFPELIDDHNNYINDSDKFKELINRSLKWRSENNSITCFSDHTKKNDMLMWANYADDHFGICLVFDSLKFKMKIEGDTILIAPSGAYQVNYVDKLEELDPLTKGSVRNEFILTKHNVWEQESEFRFIAPSIGSFEYNSESLKEIIFGLRTSEDAKKTIMNIVKLKNLDITFKQIVKKTDSFGFEIIEYEIQTERSVLNQIKY